VKHLFLGFFPYGTGVEQQYVGLLRRIHQGRAMGLAQQIEHPRRIILIHLAAMSLDKDLARGTGHAGILRVAGDNRSYRISCCVGLLHREGVRDLKVQL
jgi:hypothetical protein